MASHHDIEEKSYELEDLREFFTKRPWAKSGCRLLLDEQDHAKLEARALTLPKHHANKVRWYIRGWLATQWVGTDRKGIK